MNCRPLTFKPDTILTELRHYTKTRKVKYAKRVDRCIEVGLNKPVTHLGMSGTRTLWLCNTRQVREFIELELGVKVE